MLQLPFSREQFFGVFLSYNTAVWPAQIVLLVLAVTAIWLAFRHGERATRWIWGILAAIWLWTGVAYHLLQFTEINPAAYGFATLFVLQGVLFIWRGVLRGSLPFAPATDIRGILAALVLLYALVLYPMLGTLTGHTYLASPTFGAPCPVVIYTFGMLMLAPRVPAWLLIIPAIWAIIGTSAAFTLGVVPDAGLLVSAVIALTMFLYRRRFAGIQRSAA